MYDFIGDVHGCYEELHALLTKLGYMYQPHFMDGGQTYVYHAIGADAGSRKAVFVGDLNDRGPDSVSVLREVMGMHKTGNALAVTGNHDDKLRRYLRGNKVQPKHGLRETLDQLEQESQEFRDELRDWLETLPYRLVLDEGKVLVAHAGLPEWMHMAIENGRIRSHALYGDVDGSTDGAGLPIRKDWTKDYRGNRIVVHGHVPMMTGEPDIRNNVYNIDTACCFGAKLTALRYPEMEVVSVPALKVYHAR